jgi:anti-sigma factor NepR-like protein
MTTIGSAEPLPAMQRNPADEDKSLTQQTKSLGCAGQPHLRIVHSADRVQAPSSVNMPPRNRILQAPDRPPAMLDRTVQAQIGRLLRDVFADVSDEPVPERFVALLTELESKSKEEESR